MNLAVIPSSSSGLNASYCNSLSLTASCCNSLGLNASCCNCRDHGSLDDRIAAARQLLEAQPACPVVVDDMKDEANYAYGGMYERLYVVLDSRIVYAGERGPGGYKIDELEDWLVAYRKTKEHVA